MSRRRDDAAVKGMCLAKQEADDSTATNGRDKPTIISVD
jgi:hypothetical protein